MEITNTINKQQAANVPTSQGASVDAPKQEVKTQVERVNDVQAQKPLQEPEVRDLIDTLNKSLNPFNTSIKFGFDNSSDVFFVSVIDSNTNDTIRRFPAEHAATLVGKMNEIVGIIFDEKG
ncbi:flagellar protein FlaG [Sulfurimonas sp. MAG313]|nr:flagellar protein FlaG [Sulfurimonas sp. MAG313]MDF1881577.1 flagellar protein FlaG [Sulfurimonas sp. MAG313]